MFYGPFVTSGNGKWIQWWIVSDIWYACNFHMMIFTSFFYKEMIIITITTTPVKPISAFHQWNFASRGETSRRNYCFIYSLLKNLCLFLANKCLHNGSAYWLATSPLLLGLTTLWDYDIHWFTSSINWWVWWQINLWQSVVVGPRRYWFALKYLINIESFNCCLINDTFFLLRFSHG